ncbi:MAG TPA: phenylalanine--tRNA ligase beta subunit-related protein [Methanocella sp.]|uniref:B3/B4 domain-containing protein n=1 Tax=Methanocella sp. TaxID=2052833 RepID=UPI002D0558AD|nr:phenylalanine--tRNA ligase beta subunit-related protein [Methanocella sp.]HTY91796.1 phenylalanine--tRNA ligase beta subunit-related protein [Methanocella sp.]
MEFSATVLEKFPGICVTEGDIMAAAVAGESPGLEALRLETARDIASRYTLEKVKYDPVFRAYRDFFWSVGVDPTKTRPASEALVRRLLSGGELPRINTAVDAYNLASAASGVPIAAFDADKLGGGLTMRFAVDGETFHGIGMKEPIGLKANQVLLTDSEKIIAVYPYRDSDDTKVTMGTKNIHIVSCGVPRIDKSLVLEAYGLCARYLVEFTGGSPSEPRPFP